MRLKLERDNYGKLILIGTSVVMWLLIMFSFRAIGYEETWHLWKIPTWKVAFMDFRLIPGSAESFANGFEPTVNGFLASILLHRNFPGRYHLDQCLHDHPVFYKCIPFS